MKAFLTKYLFAAKTIPVLAGLTCGLFAASRFAQPVVTGSAADPGLLWVWPGAWPPVLAGLAAWLVQTLIWAGADSLATKPGVEAAAGRRGGGPLLAALPGP